MYETLVRPHEVHNPPPLLSVDAVREKLKRGEVRREEKRLKQIEASRRVHAQKEERVGSKKRGREKGEGGIGEGEEEGEGVVKRVRVERGEGDVPEPAIGASTANVGDDSREQDLS